MFGINFKKIDLQKMPIKKIVIIGQFLVILAIVRSCHLRDLSINESGIKLRMYENTVQEYATTVNKFGEKVSTQDQLLVQKDKQLEKALLKNSTLTSLVEQVKFEANTKIKNVMANYTNTDGSEVITVHDTILKGKDTTFTSTDYVKVGTKFSADTSKWYKAYGSVQKEGVQFDSLSFKSDFTLNIGEKKVKGYKGWLFQKKEPKVELINPNPYTNIDVMKNIKLEDKKWWQNDWLKFGAGVLIGGGAIILAR